MSAPGAPAPGGNPEDLLMQIRMLLDQYLAMGEGTPVAAEAQALAASIDAVAGGGGGMPPEAGGMPPEAGGAPPMPGGMPMGGEDPMMMSGEVPMPDMAGAPGYGGGSFAGADAALIEDIKKRRPRQ